MKADLTVMKKIGKLVQAVKKENERNRKIVASRHGEISNKQYLA